jgi:hypothetical protein
VSGTDWQLAVADNGSGKPDGAFAQPKTKLGTCVVKALAKQLDALVVETLSGASGTKVSVAPATFCGCVVSAPYSSGLGLLAVCASQMAQFD